MYYAISPLSMLFRAFHCLPILYTTKPKPTGAFNKRSERSLPCDATFHNDAYASFQFIQYKFTNSEIMAAIAERMNAWSQKHFRCNANMETNDNSVTDFVLNAVKFKPSELIGNNTHLFVLFPKTYELVCFLDHYYCDGIILFDIFKHLFLEITINLPFPKYKYYPLVSDAFATECVTRNLYDICTKPSLITQYDNKTRLLSRVTYKKDSFYWNRWSNYASNILPLFECTKGLEYVRVSLTVGIDTDTTFGNNRIGCIIVVIDRPPKNLSRKTKLKLLIDQFETNVTRNYRDCIATYDTLRSYDTTILRKFGTATGLDIIFTSMFLPVKLDAFQFGLGAFIGNDHEHPYFYINSMTLDDVSYTTYTTNWSDFNHKKYMSEFDAKLMYTFS